MTTAGTSSSPRWGEQTRRAIENFPVSGERIPRALIEALAMIKAEAAAVNGELGTVPRRSPTRSARAADEVVRGEMSDQFPVDVFQTGSGTSTNMNVNEVLAHRASELTAWPFTPTITSMLPSHRTTRFLPRRASLQSLRLMTTLLPALDSLRRSLLDCRLATPTPSRWRGLT